MTNSLVLPFFAILQIAYCGYVFEKKPYLLEQFSTKDSLKSWTQGNEQKGKWELLSTSISSTSNEDYGLVMSEPNQFYGLSKMLFIPVNAEKKPLVIQYEVKNTKGLNCGGSYVKLLTENKKGHKLELLNSSTPYGIMFGPDKCGPTTDKVHFILRHRNSKNDEISEKHLKDPPKTKDSELTTLYTLVIRPDNSFSIKIDNETVRKGNLLTDMEPPINPPEFIDDPQETKPSDWDDRKTYYICVKLK